MTAGNSNVSKYKKTYNVAWSPPPPPPPKKKKTESLIERLNRQRKEKEKAIEGLNNV